MGKIKNVPIVISLNGSKQNELLQISLFDRLQLAYMNCNEFSMKIRLSFISPIHLVNNPRINLDNGNVVYGWDNIFSGKFDTTIQFTNKFVEILNESRAEGNLWQFKNDIDYLLKTGKCRVYGEQVWRFQTPDYKLQKALGCTDQWYESVLKKIKVKQDGESKTIENAYVIEFTSKVFTNVAKQINVICYDMEKYTLYEKNKQRFIILKSLYNVEPGTYTQFDSNIDATINLLNLQTGIKMEFQDENFVQIDLEDEPYQIDLFINASPRLIAKEEQEEANLYQVSQENQMDKVLTTMQQQINLQQKYMEKLTKERKEFVDLYYKVYNDKDESEQIKFKEYQELVKLNQQKEQQAILQRCDELVQRIDSQEFIQIMKDEQVLNNEMSIDGEKIIVNYLTRLDKFMPRKMQINTRIIHSENLEEQKGLLKELEEMAVYKDKLDEYFMDVYYNWVAKYSAFQPPIEEEIQEQQVMGKNVKTQNVKASLIQDVPVVNVKKPQKYTDEQDTFIEQNVYNSGDKVQ